mgnify:CR=1 FL=1
MERALPEDLWIADHRLGHLVDGLDGVLDGDGREESNLQDFLLTLLRAKRWWCRRWPASECLGTGWLGERPKVGRPSGVDRAGSLRAEGHRD